MPLWSRIFALAELESICAWSSTFCAILWRGGMSDKSRLRQISLYWMTFGCLFYCSILVSVFKIFSKTSHFINMVFKDKRFLDIISTSIHYIYIYIYILYIYICVCVCVKGKKSLSKRFFLNQKSAQILGSGAM